MSNGALRLILFAAGAVTTQLPTTTTQQTATTTQPQATTQQAAHPQAVAAATPRSKGSRKSAIRHALTAPAPAPAAHAHAPRWPRH